MLFRSMTFPASGTTITADTINTELNRPALNPLSFGDPDLRGCQITGDLGSETTVSINNMYGFPLTSVVTRNLLLHYSNLLSTNTTGAWTNNGSYGSGGNLIGVNSPGTNATSGGSATFLRSSNQSYTFPSALNSVLIWSPTGYKGYTSITIEMWYMCTDNIN